MDVISLCYANNFLFEFLQGGEGGERGKDLVEQVKKGREGLGKREKKCMNVLSSNFFIPGHRTIRTSP